MTDRVLLTALSIILFLMELTNFFIILVFLIGVCGLILMTLFLVCYAVAEIARRLHQSAFTQVTYHPNGQTPEVVIAEILNPHRCQAAPLNANIRIVYK